MILKTFIKWMGFWEFGPLQKEPRWNSLGGVRVVHFVVCSTFCLQNCFFQPTKWYGHKLDYKMAFSSLQNGMAQTRPYKMVFLCQLYWTFFFHNDFDMFIQKWSNICIHAPKKTPGPFCRASTLSGTQLQAQFFHSHFVGFLPCHWFLHCHLVANRDWASISERNMATKF